ncbi:hypothetical protein E4T44_01779 [Aureobasidium sp. EXF-8845]|nr:hypothetical protein E4T44_01779 [Aureobasidium sp. EXF-8845]KAI4856758.1 hypothetical protein E4T45_01769 [Aureobasidium sp. EXF-8846]
MDIARFLDQPIRFNPRRASVHSASVSSSHPPSPSYESTPTSSSESDTALSPEKRFSPTQNTNATPPTTSPSLADGNEQVLDSSEHAPTPDSSTEQPNPRRHRATKDRKGITKAACSACQRRKSKCDGKRPACSACVLKARCCEYSTRVGISSQAAKRERLKSYATILGLVRDAAPGDCEKILQDLRAPKTLNEAIRNVQRNWVFESED